jgi:hypothetical protein
MTTTKYKSGVEQRYGKPQKKEPDRNPGNKKPFIQTKTTVEGNSSRLEEVEDRISELKDKIEIKEKKQKKS